MNSPLLTKLATLLQETDALIACPRPDTEVWESYCQRRQKIFTCLQILLQQERQAEPAALRDVLQLVLEKDRLLLQQIGMHRSHCQQQLTETTKAQQALRSYTPPPSIHLLDYDA